jgi:DNA-binding transcriptional regulator YbjK
MRVIIAGGLAGLTHRAVADEAKVPLGSTTYYFADRDDLLVAAMEVAIKVERGLIAKYVESNEGTLAHRLAKFISAQTVNRTARDRLRAAYELYVVGARSRTLRKISAQWDSVLRDAIASRCDEETARHLYTAVSGLALEAAVADVRVDAADATRLLARVAATGHEGV